MRLLLLINEHLTFNSFNPTLIFSLDWLHFTNQLAVYHPCSDIEEIPREGSVRPRGAKQDAIKKIFFKVKIINAINAYLRDPYCPGGHSSSSFLRR